MNNEKPGQLSVFCRCNAGFVSAGPISNGLKEALQANCMHGITIQLVRKHEVRANDNDNILGFVTACIVPHAMRFSSTLITSEAYFQQAKAVHMTLTVL